MLFRYPQAFFCLHFIPPCRYLGREHFRKVQRPWGETVPGVLGTNKEAYVAREGWSHYGKLELILKWEALGEFWTGSWHHQIYVVGAVWRTIHAGTKLGARAQSGAPDNNLGEVRVALTRMVAVEVLKNCEIQAMFSKSGRKDWL